MGKRRKVIYLDEPPEFYPKDGLFRVKLEGIAEYTITPHNLLATIERARVAYAEWQAEDHSAKPIRKP